MIAYVRHRTSFPCYAAYRCCCRKRPQAPCTPPLQLTVDAIVQFSLSGAPTEFILPPASAFESQRPRGRQPLAAGGLSCDRRGSSFVRVHIIRSDVANSDPSCTQSEKSSGAATPCSARLALRWSRGLSCPRRLAAFVEEQSRTPTSGTH